MPTLGVGSDSLEPLLLEWVTVAGAKISVAKCESAGQVVRRSESKELNAPRIHRMNDNRSTVREIEQAIHRLSYSLGALVFVIHAKTIREQHDGLPAGQLAQPANDEDNGDERSVGKDVIAILRRFRSRSL